MGIKDELLIHSWPDIALWGVNTERSPVAAKSPFATRASRQMTTMRPKHLEAPCFAFGELLQKPLESRFCWLLTHHLLLSPPPPGPTSTAAPTLLVPWWFSPPAETSFYLLAQQLKTSMGRSLNPNASVLKRFARLIAHNDHARAPHSHTVSSGGGALAPLPACQCCVCVQCAGVGGCRARAPSAAGRGHGDSVRGMTNERFMTRLVWLAAASCRTVDETGSWRAVPENGGGHNPSLNKLIISHCFCPFAPPSPRRRHKRLFDVCPY